MKTESELCVTILILEDSFNSLSTEYIEQLNGFDVITKVKYKDKILFLFEDCSVISPKEHYDPLFIQLKELPVDSYNAQIELYDNDEYSTVIVDIGFLVVGNESTEFDVLDISYN
jgi:hypothetical protein